MEEYGYAIRSVSTYNVVTQEARGAVKIPFVNANSNSEGYVTGKKPVQMTGRPYDDYKKHGFPTEAYPMKADDANKGNGGYGNYNSKEGYKPTSSPTRNSKYDDYNDGAGANKGYDGYGNNNKEGYKPTSSPTQKGKYDGYDGANKGYGGFGNSNNKEGYKPTSSNYDGYNGANKGFGGYGNYNHKEGYKPTSDPPRNGNYGKLGGATNPNKIIPGGFNKPKLGTTGTTVSPRQGIPLSEASNDIEKIIGLLEEAAINGHSNNGGTKTTDTALPYDDCDNYRRKHDGVDRSNPRNNWAASLGNGVRRH